MPSFCSNTDYWSQHSQTSPPSRTSGGNSCPNIRPTQQSENHYNGALSWQFEVSKMVVFYLGWVIIYSLWHAERARRRGECHMQKNDVLYCPTLVIPILSNHRNLHLRKCKKKRNALRIRALQYRPLNPKANQVTQRLPWLTNLRWTTTASQNTFTNTAEIPCVPPNFETLLAKTDSNSDIKKVRITGQSRQVHSRNDRNSCTNAFPSRQTSQLVTEVAWAQWSFLWVPLSSCP